VDWGFDLNHSEFVGAYDSRQYNVCTQGPITPNPTYSYHGAGSVGLIAARQNQEGIQGVAYGSKVLPIEASCTNDDFDSCDECWKIDNPWATGIAQAMSWFHRGPAVLLVEAETCCGGNIEGSLAVHAAIRQAVNAGIVVVVPAGNGNQDAACSDAGTTITTTGSILVGATSTATSNELTTESNYGSAIVVSAPGESDLTCGVGRYAKPCSAADPTRTYTRDYGGTSGASAVVAGVVALMLEKDPSLTPAQIVTKLKNTGTTIGGSKVGGVFLNAAGAIAAVDPGCRQGQQGLPH
jgi:serine protease